MRFLAVLFMTSIGFAQTPQATRGQALFLDEANKAHCGSCHALAGKGNAVGPDLSRLARIPAAAIVMAVRATRTQYVQAVKMKGVDTFPGMPRAKSDTEVSFWDLSAIPAVERKAPPSDVSTTDNASWKHPPASAPYTKEQLADIIAFVKWASYKDTKGVNPDDMD